MNEPKTVKKARELTLAKIEECMKLPIRKRQECWYRVRWQKSGRKGDQRRYCAFCLYYNTPEVSDICDTCIAKNACYSWIEMDWHKSRLRKLYRMVKEIEV